MAGMKQIETAARENDALAVAFPAGPLVEQFTLRNNFSQFPPLSARRTVIRREQFYHAWWNRCGERGEGAARFGVILAARFVAVVFPLT